MPRVRRERTERIPPSIQPQRAISLIRQQIERLERLKGLPDNDPEITKWEATTRGILDAAFGYREGGMSEEAMRVVYASGGDEYMGMSEEESQHSHVRRQEQRKALLEAHIERLELLAPPAASFAPDQYRFHVEIEKVSGKLYREANYREAALNAYIRVLEAVKEKSGLRELEGDSLVNHTFGFDDKKGRFPVIQFNSLQSREGTDDQLGFMYLFKGAVGLRNSKAHSTRFFDDPNRGHEYLAFASLLMRMPDLAKVN